MMEGESESPADRTAVLSALGGKYSAEILAATRTPASAQELSDELDVPIATCYRRIDDMVEAGLLEREGRQVSDRGRRTNVYRRSVDRIVLDVSEDRPELTVDELADAPGAVHERNDD